MTMAEVVDRSANVHLPSLVAYWKAVGERTGNLVASLRPSDLDQVVSQQRVRLFVEQGHFCQRSAHRSVQTGAEWSLTLVLPAL
jgi:hypothetical protein